MEDDEQPSFIIRKKGRSNKGSVRKSVGGEQAQVGDESVDSGGGSAVKHSLAKKDRKSLASVGAASPASSIKSARTFLRQPAFNGGEEALASLNSAPQVANTPISTRTSFSDLALAKYGQTAISTNEDSDVGKQEEIIPTTNAIAAAKLKRGLLRKLGNETEENGDFISLEVATYGSHGYKGGESRLVREEDELGEGDDDAAEFTEAQDRIALGKSARKTANEKRREGIIDLINDAQEEENDQVRNSDDDEMRDWEEAQLRRGGFGKVDTRTDTKSGNVYKPTPIPEVSSVPSLSSVQARLQQQLRLLEKEHAENEAILKSSEAELADLDKQEIDLRNEVERISRSSEWFTGMRDWVEDVAAFLDAKFPLLEKIESDNISIQRERLEMIQRRRFQDDADDISASVGTAVSADYDAYLKSKNPEFLKTDTAMETDNEFEALRNGMLNDPQSAIRQTRRSERRLRLQAARQTNADAEDGYATDDQLPADATKDLRMAVESIKQREEKIFSDVEADSFLDPAKGILPRFRDWRNQHFEEYSKSYAGLTMVNVWEFWARVEACCWNPFNIPGVSTVSANLESFTWHTVLGEYAHESSQIENGASSEDEAILGALVADVMMPRLQALAVAYDPSSATATTRALQLCEEISYSVDRDGRKFEVLVQAFLRQVQNAVQTVQDQLKPHLSEITSPSKAIGNGGIEARQTYTMRLIKLLTTALRWRRIARATLLPAGIGLGSTVEEMLARELVEAAILPLLGAGWQTGGKENAERVLSLFSKSAALSPSASMRLRAP